jgi:hypothetical protein
MVFRGWGTVSVKCSVGFVQYSLRPPPPQLQCLSEIGKSTQEQKFNFKQKITLFLGRGNAKLRQLVVINVFGIGPG